MTTNDASTFTLRRAGPADALCIAVLGLQVFLDTYATEGIRAGIANEVLESFSPTAIATLLDQPQTRFDLAESNGHLVGFAQWQAGAGHALAPGAAPAELQRLYVQQRFTGRGLGATLLRHTEHAAHAVGAELMWLTAWVGNARARRFYPRHGYREMGVTSFSFQGESHENRLFAKALPRAPDGPPGEPPDTAR